MGHNAVVWFEIYVQDMDRAKKFYEAVLGITFEKLTAPESCGEVELWAFPGKPDAPGAAGALVKMKDVPSGGSTMIYFGSQDCAIEEARIEEAGGKVFRTKFSIEPHGFITVALDPDGNYFGLHSME